MFAFYDVKLEIYHTINYLLLKKHFGYLVGFKLFFLLSISQPFMSICMAAFIQRIYLSIVYIYYLFCLHFGLMYSTSAVNSRRARILKKTKVGWSFKITLKYIEKSVPYYISCHFYHFATLQKFVYAKSGTAQ